MVFHRFAKKRKAALYLGAPEAEAESLPTSRVMLQDVYEEHHDLLSELTHEKFIVVGRKGCGKSAFAEHVNFLAAKDANLFCSFIRQDTVNMETLVQLGQEAGDGQTKEHLFKWLIYTKILTLFTNNEAAQQSSNYKLLKEFLKKNSGYIDIDKGEITELVKKHKFEVSIEQFKRFFKTKYNQDIQIKESRAPYYKLLPHLETVVSSILSSEENLTNENAYVVFFDDLDINFKSSDEESVDTLINLLRTTKYINNNVFAKSGALAKVVILIRDDIERLLSPLGADIAKLFSSYATPLNWYQEEFLNPDKEDEIGLKKLICKRAKNAFEAAEIPMSRGTPWESLVDVNDFDKSSFKYIVDHTLLRPRDLILFFKPLETGSYDLPLNRSSVNTMLGQYAAELMKELSNELSSFYDAIQIQNILDALKDINRKHNCTYGAAKNIIENNCDDSIKPEKLLDDLFKRSLIGCRDKRTHFVQFKHKQSKKDVLDYSIDKTAYIIMHSGVKIYLQHR